MTKQQKHIEELSAGISEIPASYHVDAMKNVLDKWALMSTVRYWCGECGRKWMKPKRQSKTVICPSCNTRLKVQNNERRMINDRAYYNVLQVHDGYQVVRLVWVEKFMERGKKPSSFAQEVMQHWIDKDGRITSLSRRANGFSMYCDQWIWHTPLAVRTAGYRSDHRATISGCWIHPKRNITHEIRRRGYNGGLLMLSPQGAISLVLKHGRAETLLKTKQYGLLKKYRDHRELIDTHWPSVRIAIRNNYNVTDAKMWLDHLDLLQKFGKDLRSAKYVCPADLKYEHGRYVAKMNAIEAKKEEAERIARIAEYEKQYSERIERFKNILIKVNDDIVIAPLMTVSEFCQEGNKLSHCLFTNEYFKKEESLILSARMNGIPIETIEVHIAHRKVVQAYGKNNEPSPYNAEIVKAVNTQIKKMITHRRSRAAV